MYDGDVALGVNADVRPAIRSLSDLKQKIVQVFKGADTTVFKNKLREVSTEIKAVESNLKKTQTALDAIMSGSKTPESIKNLEKELSTAQKQLDLYRQSYESIIAKRPEVLAEAQSWQNAGNTTKAKEVLDAYNAKVAEATQLYNEQADKINQLSAQLQTLKQNPQLTEEAQRYIQQLQQQGDQLNTLKEKHQEYVEAIEKGSNQISLSNNSVVNGFQRVEHRLVRLAKRVFFFSLFTKMLRGLRSSVGSVINADSALSQSLAQVRGNLATAFGSIWVTVLPAIRTFIAWIAKATQYIAHFISWLTGKSFKTAQEAMQSINQDAGGTADGVGKIGKAATKTAKKLQRMLLPFDQMNVLTKDADTGAGGGGGGGAGGAGVNPKTIWPDEMDDITKKFEKLKDLIILIGSAFAAWQLSKILAPLLGLSRSRAFIALTAIIYGITQFIEGIRSWIKEGPNFENVTQTIGGAILALGGVFLLFNPAAGAVLIVIGGVILALSKLYKHSKKFREFVDKILGKLKEFKDRLVKAWKKGGFKGVIKEAGQIGKEIIQNLMISFLKTKIGKAILKFGYRLGKAFKKGGFKAAIKEAAKIGKEIFFGILKGIWNAIKKLPSWLKKNLWNPFIKKVKSLFGISSPAKKMFEVGENILLGILEGILQAMKNIGEWISENVLKPIKEALFGDGAEKDGFIVNISAVFANTKKELAEKWADITSKVNEKIVNIKASLVNKWENLKEAWASLKEKTDEKIANIKAQLANTWTSLKTSWDSLKAKTGEKIAYIKAQLASAWTSLSTSLANLRNKVANKLIYLKASISTKVSELKNKVNEIIKKIGVKTVSLALKFSAAVQDLKNWVNTNIIDKINAKFANIPILRNHLIPHLAQGAVIPANREFLAVLGDQKRGVNIETPLSTMIDAFTTALRTNGYGNRPINVYLQGDAKELFRVVRIEADNYTQSTGKAAFNI